MPPGVLPLSSLAGYLPLRWLASVGVRAAVGTVATQADLEALVASVAGLFGEDAGRHDSLADIGGARARAPPTPP